MINRILIVATSLLLLVVMLMYAYLSYLTNSLEHKKLKIVRLETSLTNFKDTVTRVEKQCDEKIGLLTKYSKVEKKVEKKMEDNFEKADNGQDYKILAAPNGRTCTWVNGAWVFH